MALVSSLFTAISGLRNHQTMLDVISNNVANVNTIGFKSGRVMFRDLLSQTISTASGADSANNMGGTNPMQTGTGVSVSSIDTIQTQGALQATGISTDLALQGDGFFITKSGETSTYTRAGMFRFDSVGNLVDPTGSIVQGWNAESSTVNPLSPLVIDSSNPTTITNVQLTGTTLKPQESTALELMGNLDAGATAANCAGSTGVAGTRTWTVQDAAAVQTTYTVGTTDIGFTVYDSLGNTHQLTMNLINLSGTQVPGAAAGTFYDNNTWWWQVNTDVADKSVHLAMDNTTYTDPIDGTAVRASSCGFLHFTPTGAMDYVAYADRNSERFTGALDPNLPGGAAGTWQTAALADANDDSIIGFEGATIPPAAVAPFANTKAWALEKLPIVLCYQNVNNIAPLPNTPIPPQGTTAGRQALIGLAGSATTETWYVQKMDFDWGTVSTITGAVPDTAGGAGDVANNPDLPGATIGTTAAGVTRSTWGLRDGFTQDTTGSFVNGIYNPNFVNCALRSQDGYSEGTLQSISVDSNGIVTGSYSCGVQTKFQDLAQIATARFENPGGLAKAGETHFVPTSNSGTAVVGTANSGGRGSIAGGVLEQSNVDLSKELTDMIVAQRGFEVNARLITTSDRILDALVNLGR